MNETRWWEFVPEVGDNRACATLFVTMSRSTQ